VTGSRRVVVATANPHKVVEIDAILSGLDLELVAMSEFGVTPPVEDGETFEANALIKARACVAATGLASIADDSGIEVDALGGAPGIHSARYAGEPTDDAANNRRLVAELQGVADDARTARFVCAAAVCLPDGTQHVVRAEMPGRVVDEPRGEHGFGYDPHFVSDVGGGRTNAELRPEEKDAVSHRGTAFRALRPHLERLLAG